MEIQDIIKAYPYIQSEYIRTKTTPTKTGFAYLRGLVSGLFIVGQIQLEHYTMLNQYFTNEQMDVG